MEDDQITQTLKDFFVKSALYWAETEDGIKKVNDINFNDHVILKNLIKKTIEDINAFK